MQGWINAYMYAFINTCLSTSAATQRACLRHLLGPLLAVLLVPLVMGATLQPPSASSPDAGLRWIKNYRSRPEPSAVPAVIRALSQNGSIKDPETSGIYVGFLAGVLGANPNKAWSLITKVLPLPFEDQWIIIRALAYSGLPQWKDLMRALALRLPERQAMAERYISGDLPILDQVPIEPKSPATMEKVKSFFTGEMFFSAKKEPRREITFVSSPELIDILWGMYFASGSATPIKRIILLLPWSQDRDSADKLTIGSMAKFTLASNAARDAQLLNLLKRESSNQPKVTAPILKEVIDAADTVDTAHIGKEALAALEDLKRKGPGSARNLAWWGAAGEAALSFGCLGLAVAGQVEAGIPCVIGGALTTGALRYLGRTD